MSITIPSRESHIIIQRKTRPVIPRPVYCHSSIHEPFSNARKCPGRTPGNAECADTGNSSNADTAIGILAGLNAAVTVKSRLMKECRCCAVAAKWIKSARAVGASEKRKPSSGEKKADGERQKEDGRECGVHCRQWSSERMWCCCLEVRTSCILCFHVSLGSFSDSGTDGY